MGAFFGFWAMILIAALVFCGLLVVVPRLVVGTLRFIEVLGEEAAQQLRRARACMHWGRQSKARVGWLQTGALAQKGQPRS